ncbi:tyrosine-type recombinase/integrase [Tabrizicola sp.]|uniref:tyrosine-type recombinase/integrase n=1 Tax=Tabrizicola sp. TaxID=2005166 RepID=UPI003D2CCCC8
MEKQKYEDIRGDGRLMLWQRGGPDQNFSVRITVPGSKSYKRLSSKTSDRKEAIKVALELYDDLYHQVRTTGSIHSTTYGDVFNKWRQSKQNSHGAESKKDRSVEYAETYSLGYFGAMRIDQITAKDLHKYWDWRKVNFKKKKPSDETLNRERNAIQGLMRFALQHGYLATPLKIPKLETKGISRRPTFTLPEWKKITVGMRTWVEDGRAKGHWRERFVLQQYVLLLSNSGIRIGEMRNVTWDDVSSVDGADGKLIIIKVNGKTGMREVVCNPGSEVYLQRLYDLRKDELGGAAPALSEPVFINPHTGSPITSFKVGFNSMLKWCDVPIAKDGMNRTIYSLRHFYGTQRLRGNINPYILAKNMGTSVELIEKFYGHILTPDIMSSIRKTTNQTTRDRSEKAYPF